MGDVTMFKTSVMQNVALLWIFPGRRDYNNKTGVYGNNYSSNTHFFEKECH